MFITYIYWLQNTPVYVGKGKTLARAHLHLKGTAGIFSKWAKAQVEKGETFKIEVQIFQTEDEAFLMEKELIKLYGRRDLKLGTLWNFTDGGEGTSGAIVWNKGVKLGPQAKDTIEKRAKANTGQKRTPETKLKMSITQKNIAPTRAPRGPVSQETRDKLSAVNKGRVRTQEQKDAHSKLMKEKFASGAMVSWNKGVKNTPTAVNTLNIEEI